jgi:predicted nucleotidyltransferase
MFPQFLPGTPAAATVGSRQKGTAIEGDSDVDLFVDNRTPLSRDMRVRIAEYLLREVQEAVPAGYYTGQIFRRAITLRSGSDSPEYPDVDIMYALIR